MHAHGICINITVRVYYSDYVDSLVRAEVPVNEVSRRISQHGTLFGMMFGMRT